MLHDHDGDSSDESYSDVDLLAQLDNLNLDVEKVERPEDQSTSNEDMSKITKASSRVLNRNNAVFDLRRASSKVCFI